MDHIHRLRTLKRPHGSPFGIPVNIVLTVPDDGHKDRIVTKSHPGLVARA